jgi:RimJ/RimL family protein N-acetyltransferase
MSTTWPLHDLTLRTPRLELCPDDDPGLVELAARARDGVHDPAVMPFKHPWTDTADTEGFERGVLQYYWGLRAALAPEDWTLNFLVREHGRVLGTQGVRARSFAVLREVTTGSWLTRAAQGRGVGTEMRAAVLVFAFDHLGARWAGSGAFADNLASRRVSERLGYHSDGVARYERRGEAAVMHRLRVEPDTLRRPDWTLEVDGLAPCLPMLGAGDGAGAAAPRDGGP